MNKDFIVKFETENYLLGSFDTYQKLSEELVKDNSNLSDEEVNNIIKSMPTTYRASILNKEGNYIGYIGLYNIDAKNQTTSIRFETNVSLSDDEINEVLNEYKKWLTESLNLNITDEFMYISKEEKKIEKEEVVSKPNIIIPSNFLVPGISQETIDLFSNDYNIPKMQMPFSIMSNDRVIGIIGLTNLIWSNKRANLNLYLDKKLGEDIINELSSSIIDDYLDYVHNSNIHNVTLSVTGSDKNLLDIIKDTNMNYYGQIPYASIKGNDVESNMMFQHIPNMKKQNGIILLNNKNLDISSLKTDKEELSSVIDLGNGYRLVSPKYFEEENINSDDIIASHIIAMQNRDKFSIPLGEDKYILQKGNGNYGISKMVMNYSYVLVNENNKYSGYINILRKNANNTNAEIEIGISPNLQNQGLGKIVANTFYEELFSVGYASVTSAVFEFNNPSIKLHEKVAELNGIRLESYFINGRLWNMNFYSKVNPIIDDDNVDKKIR